MLFFKSLMVLTVGIFTLLTGEAHAGAAKPAKKLPPPPPPWIVPFDYCYLPESIQLQLLSAHSSMGTNPVKDNNVARAAIAHKYLRSDGTVDKLAYQLEVNQVFSNANNFLAFQQSDHYYRYANAHVTHESGQYVLYSRFGLHFNVEDDFRTIVAATDCPREREIQLGIPDRSDSLAEDYHEVQVTSLVPGSAIEFGRFGDVVFNTDGYVTVAKSGRTFRVSDPVRVGDVVTVHSPSKSFRMYFAINGNWIQNPESSENSDPKHLRGGWLLKWTSSLGPDGANSVVLGRRENGIQIIQGRNLRVPTAYGIARRAMYYTDKYRSTLLLPTRENLMSFDAVPNLAKAKGTTFNLFNVAGVPVPTDSVAKRFAQILVRALKVHGRSKNEISTLDNIDAYVFRMSLMLSRQGNTAELRNSLAQRVARLEGFAAELLGDAIAGTTGQNFTANLGKFHDLPLVVQAGWSEAFADAGRGAWFLRERYLGQRAGQAITNCNEAILMLAQGVLGRVPNANSVDGLTPAERNKYLGICSNPGSVSDAPPAYFTAARGPELVAYTMAKTTEAQSIVVARLYQKILNRTADQGGLQANVALLKAGVSLPEVISGLLASEEAIAREK